MAEKLPSGVVTTAWVNPVPGGPVIWIGVGLGVTFGVGVGIGVGVGVGVGIVVGIGRKRVLLIAGKSLAEILVVISAFLMLTKTTKQLIRSKNPNVSGTRYIRLRLCGPGIDIIVTHKFIFQYMYTSITLLYFLVYIQHVLLPREKIVKNCTGLFSKRDYVIV